MPGPAVTLRELHRLRRHLKDLQTEIDRGPRTLKLQQEKIEKQERLVRDVHEAIKKLKVTIHQKEVETKAKRDAIYKHEGQLNSAASKKEYDALKSEIVNDKKTCQRLEDETLEAMSELEDRAAKLPELEKEVQKIKQSAAKALDDIQTRRSELTQRLSEVHKTLQEMEATLPDDIRAQVERLIAARGDDALAAVQGRTCSACYTEITAQSYNNVLAEQFVLCKSCGRVLYLPE